MLALISPAKTLDESKDYPSVSTAIPTFASDAEYLVSKIRKYSANRLGKLMNVSEELAHLNWQRFQDFSSDFVEGKNAKPAIFTFKGDVYLGLEATSLQKKEIDYLQKNLAILSGLYGLLNPLDLIQPYRLEMGLPFKVTPAKSNLYKYWGKKIQEEIVRKLKQESEGEELIVNLASNEYAKAAKLSTLKVPVIEVDFKDRREDGGYKTIGFFAKKARGLMARFMAVEQIKKAEDLKAFNYEGYLFEPKMSSEKKWIYTRENQG
ncbi:MAG: peroxide stress protein YaaA [Luteibaculum sp.]